MRGVPGLLLILGVLALAVPAWAQEPAGVSNVPSVSQPPTDRPPARGRQPAQLIKVTKLEINGTKALTPSQIRGVLGTRVTAGGRTHIAYRAVIARGIG